MMVKYVRSGLTCMVSWINEYNFMDCIIIAEQKSEVKIFMVIQAVNKICKFFCLEIIIICMNVEPCTKIYANVITATSQKRGCCNCACLQP